MGTSCVPRGGWFFISAGRGMSFTVGRVVGCGGYKYVLFSSFTWTVMSSRLRLVFQRCWYQSVRWSLGVSGPSSCTVWGCTMVSLLSCVFPSGISYAARLGVR